MDPDRGVHVRVGFRERADFGEFLELDADAERMTHAILRHEVEHLGQLGGEVGEVDVAVGVDVHAVPVHRMAVLHGVGGSGRF
jgi:hypothetical protein